MDGTEAMVQLGELSAGPQALEAVPIVPGNMRTLAAVADVERRPCQTPCSTASRSCQVVDDS